MANPQKPWKAEYAKSGRSYCKTCKDTIDKEALRLGKMVQSSHFDGLMPMWNHASCIMKKAKEIKSIDDVDGIDVLRWEDQQRIRKYVEDGGSSSQGGGGSSSTVKPTANEFSIEVSQNARASCKKCGEKISKVEVRVSAKPEGKSARGLSWHHATCFLDLFPSAEVEKIPGWDSLAETERSTLRGFVDENKGIAKVKQHEEEIKKPVPKAGGKRKADAHVDRKSKVMKAEENISSSGKEKQEAADSEAKLEAQAKTFWALKDDLKKNVSSIELRQMLEANGQLYSGFELDLRERWQVSSKTISSAILQIGLLCKNSPADAN